MSIDAHKASTFVPQMNLSAQAVHNNPNKTDKPNETPEKEQSQQTRLKVTSKPFKPRCLPSSIGHTKNTVGQQNSQQTSSHDQETSSSTSLSSPLLPTKTQNPADSAPVSKAPILSTPPHSILAHNAGQSLVASSVPSFSVNPSRPLQGAAPALLPMAGNTDLASSIFSSKSGVPSASSSNTSSTTSSSNITSTSIPVAAQTNASAPADAAVKPLPLNSGNASIAQPYPLKPSDGAFDSSSSSSASVSVSSSEVPNTLQNIVKKGFKEFSAQSHSNRLSSSVPSFTPKSAPIFKPSVNNINSPVLSESPVDSPELSVYPASSPSPFILQSTDQFAFDTQKLNAAAFDNSYSSPVSTSQSDTQMYKLVSAPPITADRLGVLSSAEEDEESAANDGNEKGSNAKASKTAVIKPHAINAAETSMADKAEKEEGADGPSGSNEGEEESAEAEICGLFTKDQQMASIPARAREIEVRMEFIRTGQAHSQTPQDLSTMDKLVNNTDESTQLYSYMFMLNFEPYFTTVPDDYDKVYLKHIQDRVGGDGDKGGMGGSGGGRYEDRMRYGRGSKRGGFGQRNSYSSASFSSSSNSASSSSSASASASASSTSGAVSSSSSASASASSSSSSSSSSTRSERERKSKSSLPNRTDAAWKPKSHAKESHPKENHAGKALSVLNRVAPANFEALLPDLFLELTDRQTLIEVIDSLYDKAVYESKYVPLYAELCLRISEAESRLGQNWVEKTTTPLPGKSPSPSPSSSPIPSPSPVPSPAPTPATAAGISREDVFRRLILMRCEEQFKKDNKFHLTEEEENTLTPDEIEERKVLYRLRVKGNMVFVAELINNSLLNYKVGMMCMEKLKARTTPENPNLEDMEALAVFLKAVGASIMKARPPLMKDNVEFIKKIIAGGKLTNVVKFPLMDIIDMFEGNSFTPYRRIYQAIPSASQSPVAPSTSTTPSPLGSSTTSQSSSPSPAFRAYSSPALSSNQQFATVYTPSPKPGNSPTGGIPSMGSLESSTHNSYDSHGGKSSSSSPNQYTPSSPNAGSKHFQPTAQPKKIIQSPASSSYSSGQFTYSPQNSSSSSSKSANNSTTSKENANANSASSQNGKKAKTEGDKSKQNANANANASAAPNPKSKAQGGKAKKDNEGSSNWKEKKLKGNKKAAQTSANANTSPQQQTEEPTVKLVDMQGKAAQFSTQPLQISKPTPEIAGTLQEDVDVPSTPTPSKPSSTLSSPDISATASRSPSSVTRTSSDISTPTPSPSPSPTPIGQAPLEMCVDNLNQLNDRVHLILSKYRSKEIESVSVPIEAAISMFHEIREELSAEEIAAKKKEQGGEKAHHLHFEFIKKKVKYLVPRAALVRAVIVSVLEEAATHPETKERIGKKDGGKPRSFDSSLITTFSQSLMTEAMLPDALDSFITLLLELTEMKQIAERNKANMSALLEAAKANDANAKKEKKGKSSQDATQVNLKEEVKKGQRKVMKHLKDYNQIIPFSKPISLSICQLDESLTPPLPVSLFVTTPSGSSASSSTTPSTTVAHSVLSASMSALSEIIKNVLGNALFKSYVTLEDVVSFNTGLKLSGPHFLSILQTSFEEVSQKWCISSPLRLKTLPLLRDLASSYEMSSSSSTPSASSLAVYSEMPNLVTNLTLQLTAQGNYCLDKYFIPQNGMKVEQWKVSFLETVITHHASLILAERAKSLYQEELKGKEASQMSLFAQLRMLFKEKKEDPSILFYPFTQKPWVSEPSQSIFSPFALPLLTAFIRMVLFACAFSPLDESEKKSATSDDKMEKSSGDYVGVPHLLIANRLKNVLVEAQPFIKYLVSCFTSAVSEEDKEQQTSSSISQFEISLAKHLYSDYQLYNDATKNQELVYQLVCEPFITWQLYKPEGHSSALDAIYTVLKDCEIVSIDSFMEFTKSKSFDHDLFYSFKVKLMTAYRKAHEDDDDFD
ncbi:MIF4G domain-containing protein [Monocercomonoides exilis]|uniref:MIF4G domain-containing protein n=1 Tax=Monocercomonoides exilis TaxID=2049356 RepID=UPI003559ECA3|nr:MIF4G domain-containing protein [Monocercomonoides exilis]|eukprot:MONOS_4481.1-p1 / transcript=MONOS_4481.1 / gene=MONOS_4481 / organism=Monocercomonoides_exilis_PA203 / gene_product=MIF4G domain-containing protein / transcript_product=MIF4G domain-containing protein / location=Mono_scaffold00119:99396-105530(-) / protein_length=1939 / sequence_SO=supercontig / SO=protein_coding / is_pseudo=false